MDNGMQTMRLRNLLKRKARNVILAVLVTLLLCNVFGLHTHLLEVNYDSGFSYPADLPELRSTIDLLKNGETVNTLPINEYNYRFLIKNDKKCRTKKMMIDDRTVREKLNLVLMVKSALTHRERRDSIRELWGSETRFIDVAVRRVFVVGSCNSLESGQSRDKCQDSIDEESEFNKDIVQADFLDTYYNNTIKTMVGMKWIVNHCSNAEFALFVDDDYYVSMKNLLKFLRNPFGTSEAPQKVSPDFDGRLFSGYVFWNSSPMRHKTSKWYISLEDYRYSSYPPYVTAGAFVLSNEAIKDFYYASLYTQHFKFDDIYLGILAKKVNLVPHHNENFYYWKKSYDSDEYKDVIASHGFGDVKELTSVWMQQKSLGHA
ncbi:Beta-1,3-galactosyltransferase brn [Halotydeus destructor]|nr:Beta-1,3-galactosyltransferase brn [Halotydeus destructor]